MPKWFVYIAVTPEKKYYVGITTDPEKRIEKHNSGTGSRFAIQNGGLKLVYVSKKFQNKSLARKREVQIKGWTRIKKNRLISGEYV